MLMLPEDLKEAAMLERRRRLEEERRERIFNARQRLIGIDQAALEKQIEEQKLRKEAEKREDEAFEKQRLRDAKLGLVIERNIEQERRQIEADISRFRSVYQRPEARREFDLNDPDLLKKSLPARADDDDDRCGISAAQKFAGEDLGGAERKQAQRNQLRAWLDQQTEERRAAEEARREAERRYAEVLCAQDRRAADLDRLQAACRKQLDEAVARFNKALAEEQGAEKQLSEMREEEDNRADVYNCLTGDMLSENPDVSASNLGPNRCIGYMYRGMTPEQRRQVREFQLHQMEEKKLSKEAEARRNAEWEELANATARHVEMISRDAIRKQKEQKRQLLEQNKLLAQEQKSHQEYLKKFVFTNELKPEYYDKFNKTTR